jgi:Carboxypeptidase regulatory-like domain
MTPVQMLMTGALLASVLAADAQQIIEGAISGVVTDASGGGLPGVTVTAIVKGQTRTSISDESGRFRVELLPGTYHIEAQLTGFRPERLDGVMVEAGRDVTWNPTLQLPEDTSTPVETFIEQLTGSEARNCGRHTVLATAGAMRESIECVLAASAMKIAASTIKEQMGIDSRIASGFLVQFDGSIFWFRYDSHPCGGPSARPQCSARFTTEPCLLPSVREDPPQVDFVCRRSP